MKKNLEFYLTLIALVIVIYVVYKTGERVRQMEANCMLQGGDIARDSIQQELTRYQLALEMLKEEDSDAADKFETILYKFE